jgi:hypothetical protein
MLRVLCTGGMASEDRCERRGSAWQIWSPQPDGGFGEIIDALGRRRLLLSQHVVRSRDENMAYLMLLAAERSLAAEPHSGATVRSSNITWSHILKRQASVEHIMLIGCSCLGCRRMTLSAQSPCRRGTAARKTWYRAGRYLRSQTSVTHASGSR